MNVISLDHARSRLRGPRRIEPPAALSLPMRLPREPHVAEHGQDGEDRVRMRQNVAALVVIVAIVTLGCWLMESLHYYSRLQACVEAGHRNCLPLQSKYMPSPYWR